MNGVAVLSVLAVLALTAASPAGAEPGGSAPIAASNPRCNHDQAGILERQARDYDRRAPADTLNDLTQRDADLNDLMQQAQIERDILHEICSSAELEPIYDQLAGVIAWAYALQADAAVKRFALLNCGATASEAQQALIASAWAALGTTFSIAETGSTPAPMATAAPLVKEVIPKVESRAAVAGLKLPPLRDATAYWRETIVSNVAPCPASTP